MGALYFVEADINSKLGIITNINSLQGGNNSLEDLILKEISSNTIRTPTSCGRTLLRLVRALSFLKLLLKGVDDREELGPCASAAYEVTMKPHHTWIVKNTVWVALKTLPYRADFLTGLNLDPNNTHFQTVLQLLQPIEKRLVDFYNLHQINDLP
uniref:Glycolipid transfer protein domain-containing protein n=1 Tax=Arcella intermedia TaxID=1963864 RepID=A0A6B2LNW6_9EUKA